MPTEQLDATTRDGKVMDAKTQADRDAAQIELCKRHKWKWTDLDGTVRYQPPDWQGP